MRILREVEKINFSVLGMRDMMTLIDLPINMDFLKAAACYWKIGRAHV